MSSPDPLNDSDEEAIIEPSSAHRATRSVTRSLRTDRYLARDTSPRKQMFELEVGDNKSPQKLLVTVETEGATATVPDGGARRKLFQSSSPLNMIRHRERATTTTVPLKETIEEELADPNATPKRRGRPRKSNGTPIPGAGVKRRAGTPIKRTPRRPRITKSTDLDDELDLGLPELQPEPQLELQPEPQPTPKSARRGRPPKDRITELDDGLELGQPEVQPTPKSARRGRPPKNRTTELSNGTEQPEAQPTPKPKRRGRPPKNRTAEPSSELGIESSRGTTARARGRQAIIPEDLMEMTNEAMDFAPNDDIEAQEDNEVTFVIPPSETGASEGPIAATAEPASEADSDIWMATLDDEPTPRAANRTAQSAPAASSEPEGDTSQAGDYGYLAPAASDISSDDAPPSESGPGGSDTIAQGEDFSMIFMDSLPSIQELRSSVRVPVEDDYGEETSLIINNTLESLRQSLRKRDESDANKETAEAPEKISPVLIETAPAEPRQPSIRPPMTFSPNRNLSPRWLRSPRRGNSSPLRHQVLKSKARQTDDNAQNAGERTIDTQEAPSSEKRMASGHLNEGDSNMYDDSFSEIPQDVLQAATPRRPRTTTRTENLMDEELLDEEPLDEEPLEEDVLEPEVLQEEPFQELLSQKQVQGEHFDEEPMEQEYMEEEYVEEEPLQEEDLEEDLEEDPVEEDPVEEEPPMNESVEEDQEMEDAPPFQHNEDPSVPESASNMSIVSRSDAGRLPTPDDTPPQIEAQTEDQGKSTQTSQASQPSVGAVSPKTSFPLAVSARRSQVVPEIVEEMVDDLEEELPRDSEPDASRLWLDSRQPRPKVTPVNQMTSPLQDPQSLAPETAQEKMSRPLLSPIVRAGRALQSVTSDPPSPEPREHQLRSPFRSSVPRELGPTTLDTQTIRRKSMSPRRPLSFPPANPSPSAGQLFEDPFGSDSRHTGQHSFMEALERSTGNRSPSESLASSMRIVPPDDVKMSWIADEGPISANLRGDVPLKDFARSTTTNVANGHMFQAQNDEMTDEVDDQSNEGDDDTDIWEFEAERATPRTTRQQPFGNRRRALPSTWTKEDTRRPQRDVSLTSRREEASPVEKAAPEEAQADDYSLLAQRQAAKEPQAAPQSVTKARGFDLSSFFSSPAAIPGMLAEKFLPSKTTPSFGARPTEPEPVQAAPALLTSSMFPQVAQKEFQPRNSPRKDLFSPAKVAQREFQQQSSPHEDPFPVPRAREPEPSLEEQVSSSQQTSEDFEMPSVAQKQNFTPRPKLLDTSFFKSSTRSAAPTPPRMQLSHADIQRWQHETSVASESPETSGTLLRPLPARNASPSKSSLRSPLKPHTPGRVVEFTSSVLSPVEQAKVRHMRRLSNSSASQPAPPPQRPHPQRADKENHDATDITMSDASPLAKTPQPEPLSQSVWTRQHWLLLDEFLQLRRAGPYELIYERRADKYLGKMVKSHGEAMIMERWHLDIVDAFKAAVGGWDEATLVKRLFALIVGEEKRGQGIVERPSRVMFH